MAANMESLIKTSALQYLFVKPFMAVSRRIWWRAPETMRRSRFFLEYGRLIHRFVRMRADINPNYFTCFMRNRPQYELIRDLAAGDSFPVPLRMAVVGCSKGAEVFSLKFLLQQAGLAIHVTGIDISDGVLRTCREGRFPKDNDAIGELTPAEREALLEDDGDCWRVRDELRAGINWLNYDIRNTGLREKIGVQHVLVANNVLIHMPDEQAAECLRNLAGTIAAGGYLCISGIKLEIRARVARELNLQPVTRDIRLIHHAFPRRLKQWPWKYYGLEPYDPGHPDHDYRYATVFRVPPRPAPDGPTPPAD